MKLTYKLVIDAPSSHQVRVIITGKKESHEHSLDFFLPRWSPGSYLIREYSRHLSNLVIETTNGERLNLSQTDISSFNVDWKKSDLKKADDHFIFSYLVYCHELTVRTSHVDASHAFLHLPALLMGITGKNIVEPSIELQFPPAWSKVTTGLKDISVKREVFIYSAPNYDDLIDSPIEIGCHETDGFRVDGIEHDVAYYGQLLPHKEDLKADTKKIVEHIQKFMGGMPYEKYTFLTHFVPGLFGGLEHRNSTALQFCPTQITNRKGYANYLALIAHEYFHTWNVKRIRPIEFGPFNYLKEATTKLLWLSEGLTSFMDELFIYRAGLISQEEYLDMQKDNLNRYLGIPGRKFHSLDDSSFNAWIKLYRPDENSNNSSVSYYLKGGIVFFALNVLLAEKKKSINDLLALLWKDYQDNPQRGVTPDQVYQMVELVGGKEIREQFEIMTSTTIELDIESLFLKGGMKFEWEKGEIPWLGFDSEFNADRVFVKAVILDGPAYKGGLNAGDEIIAINGVRILKDRFAEHIKFLRINDCYTITICRLSTMSEVIINVGTLPPKIKAITGANKEKLDFVLNP